MSKYWDNRFIRHLVNTNIEYICEVGARYGDESIMLSSIFPKANIISFECNPNTVNICEQKLRNYPNIKFFNHGLGELNTTLPFFSFTSDNDGASSFLKRIDFNNTQKHTGDIIIKSLNSVLKEENISHLDLLCMDIQGYELNVLKGGSEFLSKINYVIMEEPKPIINIQYLPEGVHSKYIGCPTSLEIKTFMNNNNFIEIERISENLIEDNVMYKRII